MKADTRGRTDGWVNKCCLAIPGDPNVCGRLYWYAANKQQRMELGPDGEPGTEPHVCRIHAYREDSAQMPAEPNLSPGTNIIGVVSTRSALQGALL